MAHGASRRRAIGRWRRRHRRYTALCGCGTTCATWFFEITQTPSLSQHRSCHRRFYSALVHSVSATPKETGSRRATVIVVPRLVFSNAATTFTLLLDRLQIAPVVAIVRQAALETHIDDRIVPPVNVVTTATRETHSATAMITTDFLFVNRVRRIRPRIRVTTYTVEKTVVTTAMRLGRVVEKTSMHTRLLVGDISEPGKCDRRWRGRLLTGAEDTTVVINLFYFKVYSFNVIVLVL